MHCPPPPTLEVLESVLAKRGLGLRRELVTPSVRTQQCSLSRDQRRCATCAMRAALAVCERFQHESSSPCYRSSGGWVECSRLSESAASCGATSSADTTSSSPGSRYRAREARRSSARSLRFVGRRCFRHQVLLRGCGQWFRCGRDRVARPSEQENLDPRPQRNRRRQEDVSKGEPSNGQTGLHSRSSDLTSELQSSVWSDEVVIATEQLQVLIEPLCRASVGKRSSRKVCRALPDGQI